MAKLLRSVRLDEFLYNRLMSYADENERTFSEELRRAILFYISNTDIVEEFDDSLFESLGDDVSSAYNDTEKAS